MLLFFFFNFSPLMCVKFSIFQVYLLELIEIRVIFHHRRQHNTADALCCAFKNPSALLYDYKICLGGNGCDIISKCLFSIPQIVSYPF